MKKIFVLMISFIAFYSPTILAAADQSNELSTELVKSKNQISEVALNQPVLKDAALLNWAVDAIKAVNTFDYSNYKQKSDAASEYFTRKAWSNYQKAFKKSGNLKQIMDNELTVSVDVSKNPTIADQGVNADVYFWKVEVPVAITYQGATNKVTQPSIITMQIHRVPVKISPEGIAVVEYTIEATDAQQQ